MRPTKETYRIAKEAVLARGFDYARFLESLPDGVAYTAMETANAGRCVGIPHVVIVHTDLSISWTNLLDLP